jgi:methylmalonyl-CoA mutase N-terminal domain/subunit
VQKLLEEVSELGGAAGAIESGFFQDAIARSAYSHQKAVESGDRVVVGVNRFVEEEEPSVVPAPDYSRLASAQVNRVREARASHENQPLAESLKALSRAAQGSEGLMPRIIDAVRARATVGEISDALRDVWGTFKAPG